MNKLLFVLAMLSAGLTLIHIFGGGADVHAPILESDLDVILKGYSSVIWHAVSANLAICSLMLFVAANRPQHRFWLSSFVLMHFLAYIALFVGYGLSRFGSLAVMPPWMLFAVLSILIGISLWRERESNDSSKPFKSFTNP